MSDTVDVVVGPAVTEVVTVEVGMGGAPGPPGPPGAAGTPGTPGTGIHPTGTTLTVGTTAPGSPVVGDVWIDTT